MISSMPSQVATDTRGGLLSSNESNDSNLMMEVMERNQGVVEPKVAKITKSRWRGVQGTRFDR